MAVSVAVVILIALAAAAGFPVPYQGTGESPANITAAAFSYAPAGQVRVDSVWATESPSQNGMPSVTFWVSFVNAGSSPVYAIGGWVGMMSSNVTGGAAVLQTLTSPRCLAAIFISTVGPGRNLTIYTPDCGSGVVYRLVHQGNVEVTLRFSWATDLNETTPFSNSTTVSASFTFAY